MGRLTYRSLLLSTVISMGQIPYASDIDRSNGYGGGHNAAFAYEQYKMAELQRRIEAEQRAREAEQRRRDDEKKGH